MKIQLAIWCALTSTLAVANTNEVVRNISLRKLPPLDTRFRHLMLDDYVVSRHTANVKREFHQARKLGRPLLSSDRPHEREAMALNVPSVLYDRQAGKYRMWWHNVWFRTDQRGRRRLYIPPAYAESADGLNWTKPKLNQVDYHGDGGTNNCLTGISDPLFSVCFDHEGKIRGFWCPRNGTAVLQDGTKVTDPKQLSLGVFPGFAEIRGVHARAVSDQWRVMYDPVNAEYRATAKTWATLAGSKVPAKFRRAITIMTSKDAKKWTHTGRIIQTDLAYDRYAEQLPNRKDRSIPAWSELHDMNLQRYEQLLVGLNCILFTYDENGAGGKEIIGSNTKHFLTWSRDGLGWSRPERRVPLIPVEWGTDDWGRHTTGSPFMIVREKEIWIYCDIGHGHKNNTYKPPRGKTITLAKLRRDGFASYSASGRGWIETAPFIAEGQLRLNVDASSGSARVGVMAVSETDPHVGPRAVKSIPGFAVEDCRPITADQFAATVKWRDKQWSDLKGRLVNLRIQLHDAELYSFWTRTNSGQEVVTNLVDDE